MGTAGVSFAVLFSAEAFAPTAAWSGAGIDFPKHRAKRWPFDRLHSSGFCPGQGGKAESFPGGEEEELLLKGEGGKMADESSVLCAANSYIEKFYWNPAYRLPEEVRKRLQILAVRFTEEVGGILILRFHERGSLELQSVSEEGDYLYDEIGAELKLRELSAENQELFQKLELYFQGMEAIRRAGTVCENREA